MQLIDRVIRALEIIRKYDPNPTMAANGEILSATWDKSCEISPEDMEELVRLRALPEEPDGYLEIYF